MMATVPLSSSSLLPLLESLEDNTAGQPEQTDAYLTIANRLNGDEGRQFLPAVVKHFSRLGKTFQTHISSQNAELSQAALQALGFCVFHAHVVSAIPVTFADDLLSSLSSLVMNSTDKNTCTRALWVISKQNFPSEVVAKKVPEILRTLECLQMREDLQSVVIEHESLNVIVRLLEQAPVQMGESSLKWAKLVIPLVVHSASKVRLRAAGALEMGLPLLLEKQKEVAAIIEPIMSSKLIPELQKMFSTKNETNVLKLWPLFVRLLGKLLHRGGPFINSLLGLEELGFRSSSPNIKKIAFIAWKSLIDNFALNPDILCSAKRLKLLMQPLSSIHVRTEALLLTKLEVWWYLVVKLGPNLPAHFEQVGVPLLQCTLGPDTSTPGTPARGSGQSSVVGNCTPKAAGAPSFSSPVTPRLNLNSSVMMGQSYPSIQLLGLEMLLHYFLGPEITTAAAKNKLTLSLEPLVHPFLSSPSSFNKHALLLISAIRDSFICIGKDAPEALLTLIWKNLLSFVSTTIDAAGHKKERQGSEVLTWLLQALQNIVSSEVLPPHKALCLLQITVKGIPQRVLGSASYQVGKMDVLNGTPALFLVTLFYHSSQLAEFVQDERFFLCLENLMNCGLSGPTSPLAFGDAVLGVLGQAATALGNKEQLWRMWSVVVNPLTDTITQTNEVNQGDALEHNFSAVHAALMFPVTHLLPGKALPPMTQKSMLATWSRLYKVFARCSALVATAEENVCCEELCAKMAAVLDRNTLKIPSTLELVANILLVIIENADFSPYTPQFQQKMKSPHTPLTWVRKKTKALGNLSTFQTLLLMSLEAFTASEASDTVLDGTGPALVSILSCLFSNLALATAIQEALASLTQPLTALYKQAGRTPSEQPKFILCLETKLQKLLGDVLGCLQTRSAFAYDDELLSLLSPLLCVLFLHRIKHVHSLVTQFWNATFANAMILAYPEDLRPVLSQVKQNTPILLPGFQSVDVPDELSGRYSSESSQLETMLSGVQVTPGVKRNSLLPRAGVAKDRNSKISIKPVSTKLDFGSPKPPRREALEEEASVDFVFIPPETKERVLTEHQKEVKRNKRVDIPAMYNNLDASLDTTAFTQYSQSQEESLDKLGTDEQPEDFANDEGTSEMEVGDGCEIMARDTQEYTSLPALTKDTEKEKPAKEIINESADVSMDDANEEIPMEQQDIAMESREKCTSPNVSGGSDMVSGTPQKPSSRRQSFITLEKYAEGKPASPASVVNFTGPLTGTSNCQETEYSSEEPIVENEADTDTQTLLEELKEVPGEVIGNSQEEEESEGLSEDSPSSRSTLSQGDLRRSGRRRSRPLRPGEEADELDKKKSQHKELTSHIDSPKSTPSPASPNNSQSQGRASRRSKVNVEVEEVGRERLRTRSQREVNDSRQSNSQVATPSPTGNGNSQSQGTRLSSRRSNKLAKESVELVKDAPKRRSIAKEQLSQTDSKTDTSSDTESRSKTRPTQRSKPVVEDCGSQKDRANRAQKGERPSLTDSLISTVSQPQSQSPGRARRSKAASDSEEFDLVYKVGKKVPTVEEVSQIASKSPVAETVACQSLGKTIGSSLVSESEDKEKVEINVGMEDKSSQRSIPSAIPTDILSQVSLSINANESDLAKAEVKNPDVVIDSATGPVISQAGCLVTTSSTNQIVSKSRKKGRPSKITKILEEQVKASSSPNPNPTTEVEDQSGTPGSSQGSRMKTRRSAPLGFLSSKAENSELDVSVTSDVQKPRRSGKKPRFSEALPVNLATVLSGEPGADQEGVMDSSESSLKSDPSSKDFDVEDPMDVEDGQVLGSSLPLITNTEVGQEAAETELVDIEGGIVNATDPVSEEANGDNDKPSQKIASCIEPDKSISILETVSSQEGDSQCDRPMQLENELPTASETVKYPLKSSENIDTLEDDTVFLEQNQLCTPPIAVCLPKGTKPSDASEEKLSQSLQASESSQDAEVMPKPVAASSQEVMEDEDKDMVEDKENRPPEDINILEEDQSKAASEEKEEVVVTDVSNSFRQAQPECPSALEQQKEQYITIKEVLPESTMPSIETGTNTKPQADEIPDNTPLQESAERNNVNEPKCEEQGEETQVDNNDLGLCPVDSGAPQTEPNAAPVPLPEPCTSKHVCHDSPPKQKGLEGIMGLEVGQSPISAKTKGVWSPSASPSTSILKKGQKRPIEEESPSPFNKCRRVSFADPIQHQELADDIDRRSPVVRTSSPRAKTTSSIPQPKFITTPTKALLSLSPRNLCSPGYKSSKKCLISEMGQEPRPIPKDCVYPALVSCSTPVEAVLPQITSNMWPRGFGQLVRARNIKTVGDLSALTPSEIKSLPIRSPKISNVKKALKTYHEQQRKGRSDELKSFDEMEKMTSEQEEPSLPQNQEEEEDKAPGEALATEMLDDPVPMQQDKGPEEKPDQSGPDDQHPEGDLLSEVEALGSRLAGEELSFCSPDQLLHLHDHLGAMMRTVVVQLQSRVFGQNKDNRL
ncbi:hypothetical protein UPYG_G00316070 [Umbra pygmaea]|uniref:Telomere-associated protein Rif1 N-terminal domain-containing protein n=1 Tax=Umbra pygmaea TaxID=75934 RepID=A0ABD0VZV7_UMBPY